MSGSAAHKENPVVLKVSAARILAGKKPRISRVARERGIARIPKELVETTKAQGERARLMKGSVSNEQGETHERRCKKDKARHSVNECLLI